MLLLLTCGVEPVYRLCRCNTNEGRWDRIEIPDFDIQELIGVWVKTRPEIGYGEND